MFANALGIINTKIILTIVFYGFLTPIAYFLQDDSWGFHVYKKKP
jgi:hypothetical protein